MSLRRTILPLFFLVVCLLAFVRSGLGQTDTATVSGLITDPQGRVVPGVQVTVTNIDTNVTVPQTTNSAGLYVVVGLKPGRYRVSITKEGFRRIDLTDLIVNVQDVLSRNFQLQLGPVMASITVVADSGTVNTESAAVSTVIDRKFVGDLPLNGRSFNTLLQLTPGVVIAPLPLNNEAPGQFSIAGQRTDANNFTVDGVSANFGAPVAASRSAAGTGGAQAFSVLGGTSSLVSVDALQEFRIETSSFAPEFGRTPGGQVILTTRSGTNNLHGGIFDYFRNTVMDANDWFANKAGNPRAPEHHNDFGGFFGGPIWKNKTFFFFSYEGARLDQPQTTTVQVPSQYARTNAPAALAPFLDAYPLPDDRTVTPGVYTAPFTGTYANAANLDAASIRVDHTFGERFSIFGRYNYAPSQGLSRINSLSTRQTTTMDTQTLTVGVNMQLGPHILNALRANYSAQSSRGSFALDSFGGAVPLDASLLLGSLPASKNFATFNTFDTDYLLVGSAGRNQTHQANITDDLTIIVGSHQLKFGTDYRAILLDAGTAEHEPEYSAQDIQTFLSTGSVSMYASTSVSSKFLAQSFSLYSQDTWKIKPRLALTYGLRWELSPAPSARGNTTLAAWENVNNPASLALAPSGTPLWATRYDSFAPRFGFAYSLTSRGDFVLRAGTGIFYDLGVGSSASLALRFPNSTFAFFPAVSVPLADLTPFLPVISLQPPYPDGAQGFSPDLRVPRSYQWNVALEKSFNSRQVLTATYVGQAGRNLQRIEALTQPNANFAGDFLLTLDNARSNYNALQLQYRRPLASRLQALLNYTWSHSLDNASNDVVEGLSSVVISAAKDYASSDFDARHSFSGAISYDIPAAARSGPLSLVTNSWSIQGVAVARTGFPFNGVVLFASPDPSEFALSRPDLVPGQPLWINNASAPGSKSLNPNAFSVPLTPRQGTEGRNDIPGLGLTQIDLSIARKFRVGEHISMQFRADAFNVFNHPNFTNPLAYVEFGPFFRSSTKMLNQGLGGLSPLFQEGGPRSLQLSLKMMF